MNAHQRRRFARQFPPGSVVTIPWGFSGHLTATVKSNDGRSAALNGVDKFGNTFFVRACATRLKQRPDRKAFSTVTFPNPEVTPEVTGARDQRPGARRPVARPVDRTVGRLPPGANECLLTTTLRN